MSGIFKLFIKMERDLKSSAVHADARYTPKKYFNFPGSGW